MNDSDKKLIADFFSSLIRDSADVTGKILETFARLAEAYGSALSTTDPAQFAVVVATGLIAIWYFGNTDPYKSILRKVNLLGLLSVIGVPSANHINETTYTLPGGLTLTITPLSPFGISLAPTAQQQPPNSDGAGPPFLTGNRIIDEQGTPFRTQFDATITAFGIIVETSAGSLLGANLSPIVEQGADGLFYITDAKQPNFTIPGSIDLCGPLNDFPGVRGCVNSHNSPTFSANIKFYGGKYHVWGIDPNAPIPPGTLPPGKNGPFNSQAAALADFNSRGIVGPPNVFLANDGKWYWQ